MGNDEVRKTEISPFERWSLSLGSTIGWGSLVVTCSNYLAQAGIAGSVLGLVLGFILMLMVAGNYHFLSARYPGPGGLYGYVKNVMGNDASFLAAWFMVLVQGHDYEIRDSIMDELNALIESNIGSIARHGRVREGNRPHVPERLLTCRFPDVREEAQTQVDGCRRQELSPDNSRCIALNSLSSIDGRSVITENDNEVERP